MASCHWSELFIDGEEALFDEKLFTYSHFLYKLNVSFEEKFYCFLFVMR